MKLIFRKVQKNKVPDTAYDLNFKLRIDPRGLNEIF